jgi:cytochrome c oxidase assembly protein subunit 15
VAPLVSCEPGGAAGAARRKVRSLGSVPSLRARITALRRAPITPATYQVLTLVALVFLGAIVVSGAAVRLTGSGMGCPTWPNCEDGSLVPRGATGEHGWIEFVNRLFTGVVSVAVVLAVLGARRLDPPRPDLVRWAWGLVAGVAAQALLGGLVVLLHVAPLAVAGHYLLSAVLVWNAVVLHHKAGQPAPGSRARPASTPALLRRAQVMLGLGALVLVTGTFVTGSGPHGGDEAADRLPFAVTTVARIHSITVWAFLVAVVLVLRRVSQGDTAVDTIGRGRLLVGTIVAQGLLGYVQYAAGVPEILVAGHVLGSVLVWVAAVRFQLALTDPLPVAAPAPAPGAPADAAVAT